MRDEDYLFYIEKLKRAYGKFKSSLTLLPRARIPEMTLDAVREATNNYWVMGS